MGEEWERGEKAIFENIMTEQFSKIDRRCNTQIQKGSTNSKRYQYTHTHTLLLHIIIKLLKTNTEWKSWKYTGKEKKLLNKEIFDVDISVETVEYGKQWYEIFNVLKTNNSQPSNLYWEKYI